ncbi:hypothetical protein AB0M87_00990 [Streptomyces sp. NPDC051320]|uniref:hypothetical protein n=1 Tax=Streptomyces sp. NPDC051320 TaxID=3154644 RepID=UPI003437CF05
MFRYELQKIHTAELIRAADAQRLVAEVRKERRTARRSRKHEAQGPVSSLRARFVRAA